MDSVTATSVTLKDGTTYTGKNVVICCGAYTIDKFDKLYNNVKVIETETFTFDGDLGTFYSLIK